MHLQSPLLCTITFLGSVWALPGLKTRQSTSSRNITGVPSNTVFSCNPNGGAYVTEQLIMAGSYGLNLSTQGQSVNGLTGQWTNITVAFPAPWHESVDGTINYAPGCDPDGTILAFPIGDYLPKGPWQVFGLGDDDPAGPDRVLYNPSGSFCAIMTSPVSNFTLYHQCKQGPPPPPWVPPPTSSPTSSPSPSPSSVISRPVSGMTQ